MKKFIFILFVFLSILFLISGVYSAYTLANIEREKAYIFAHNPAGIDFHYTLNNSGYALSIEIKFVNEGVMDYKIKKISWICFLLNGSKKYQANDYSAYYPDGISVPREKNVAVKIMDAKSVKQWVGVVYPHLVWQREHNATVKWYNQISVDIFVDNYNGEQYKYSVRTWYLWHLAEVRIQYEKIVAVS